MVRALLAGGVMGAALALFGWLGPVEAPPASAPSAQGPGVDGVAPLRWRSSVAVAPGSAQDAVPTAPNSAPMASSPATPAAVADAPAPAPGAGAPPPPPAADPYRARAPGAQGGAAPTRDHLPLMPGATAMADDAEAGAAPGGAWSATLSTRQPAAEVAAYYRAELKRRAQPGDPPMEDLSPSQGQYLLSQVNPSVGERHAVWIGDNGDGQVTVRLIKLRTQP